MRLDYSLNSAEEVLPCVSTHYIIIDVGVMKYISLLMGGSVGLFMCCVELMKRKNCISSLFSQSRNQFLLRGKVCFLGSTKRPTRARRVA